MGACEGAQPFAAGATALTGRGLSSNVRLNTKGTNEHAEFTRPAR